jgi:hypothetical protein
LLIAAVPLLSVAGGTSDVPPTLNVTVPVALAGVTVAVSVVVPLLVSGVAVTAVVVASPFTVNPVELLEAAKVELPP